ncbi:MAG: hypothetical protein RIM23_29575 [Coleofasciculus sp. G3-WIS-01]|uniref:hypothetical protein n=1 Tax=Coleofasciculus sp. G3-WIS-01 TaxID=3069528 RepID=UPI003303ACF0
MPRYYNICDRTQPRLRTTDIDSIKLYMVRYISLTHPTKSAIALGYSKSVSM